jgi:hypothetical protein
VLNTQGEREERGGKNDLLKRFGPVTPNALRPSAGSFSGESGQAEL